jgi:hypothetical protein
MVQAREGHARCSRRRSMRASFARLLPWSLFVSLASVAALAVAACSGQVTGNGTTGDGPGPTSRPKPAVEPLCTVHDGMTCAFLTRHTLDEPPHEQAIVWGQVSTVAVPSQQSNTPKLAVYEDGTLRRNTVLRNLAFDTTPPRGLVVAKVAASSLARLRADVAALGHADLAGFYGPSEHPSAADSFLDVIEVGAGSGCSHPAGGSHSECKTVAYARVEADLAGLAVQSEAKWRAAQAGMVSLGLPFDVAGDWPLADDGSGDGTLTLTDAQLAELQAVGSGSLYRMPNGDYRQLDATVIPDGSGTALVYTTRMSAVILGDDMRALRDELLSNAGRYLTTHGEWLGVELGTDRFPAFKYRELAVIPASGTSPVRVLYLYTIEQLDLRGDGDLEIP